MIRVLVADDQTLLREGLQTIINLEDDMRIVGLAGNGQEAADMAADVKPDLILMDIKMPVMNGIDSMRSIKRELPGILVIMLTTFIEDELIVDALAGGADGFLLKDMAGDHIVQTIREAFNGPLLLPPRISAQLTARLLYSPPRSQEPFHEKALKQNGLVFKDQERKMILLMIKGHTNKQIAAALHMSEGTVRNYISVIYDKIGTNDRSQAILSLKEFLLNHET
ncbi:response regulator [Cohnella faecalis]|uniref:DNA-binding response regulator n=1 Tax=Cohnella faecalis TaxID=2315694 RepID=A0A398CTI8_9BACL|nr:response regulator transcription factor [Cohnella faecalis]RIE02274.1 DNA-binding response regulator [Cohnella faecalis]